MKDSTLLRVAVAASLVGLAGLYFISGSQELAESSFSEAKDMDEYEDVSVRGTVTHAYTTGNLTIIRLTRMEEIKVVAFEEVDVSEGSLIQVVGRVKDYEGEKEVAAERIRVIG